MGIIQNATAQQQSEPQQPQQQLQHQQQNQQHDLFGMEGGDSNSLQISSAPSQTSKSMFILDQGTFNKDYFMEGSVLYPLIINSADFFFLL